MKGGGIEFIYNRINTIMSQKDRKLLLIITLISLLFFWAVALDITPLLRGPAPHPIEWQWGYYFVNTLHKLWLPLLLIIAISGLYWFLEKQPFQSIAKNERKILLLLVLFAFLFQLSVIYFSRAGLNVLLGRIINPGLSGYFTTATKISDLKQFLKDYHKDVLNYYMHARAHPPGGVLFYYFINKAVAFLPSLVQLTNNILPQREDIRLIWLSLKPHERLGAILSGLLMPFVSSLTLVPLYYLARLLYGAKVALKSAFLFLFIPSVILFTPLLDVIFPLFSALTVYYLINGLSFKQKQSVLFSGVILSLGIFFGLNMLPLVLMTVLLFLLYTYLGRLPLQSLCLFSLLFVTGLLFLPVVLFAAFHFNYWGVIKSNAISGIAPRNYLIWLVYNPYDFFVYCGIPILIGSLLYFVQQIQLLIKAEYKKLDLVLFATFATLIVLNISGFTRGEVGRLWLAFVPFVVLPTAVYFTNYHHFSSKAFLLILLIQSIQVLTIQAFWVPLW